MQELTATLPSRDQAAPAQRRQSEDEGAAAPIAADAADIPKPLEHQRSRWLAGPSTFGPRGRLLWTAATLAIPLWFLFLSLFVGLIAIAIGVPIMVSWCGFIAPKMLRDIWARDVHHVPVPPIPPSQQLHTWDGHRIPTLEEYVATQRDSPDVVRG